MLQTKTSHLWRVRYAIILLGWRYQTYVRTTFYNSSGLTRYWMFNGTIYYVWYLQILRFYLVWQSYKYVTWSSRMSQKLAVTCYWFQSFISLKGARSNCFKKNFKLSEILVSEESSYFSRYPWWILELKNVRFGRY